MARMLGVACSCALWATANAGLSNGVGFPVGVAVSAGNEKWSFMKDDAAKQLIKGDFSEMTAGNIMKMSYVHPQENKYTFGEADKMISWARSNGIKIHGHALVWHSDYQVPKFMKNYNGDFKKMFADHCRTVAKHFRGKVTSWDVANEVLDPNSGSCYRDSVFYRKLGKEFVSICFKAAREGDPGAKLYYNDYNTEWDKKKLSCQMKLIDDLKSAGAPIDGIGFQTHIGMTFPSIDAIKNAFRQTVKRGLMVKITEIDIPIKNGYSEKTQDQQKQRYKSVIKAYLEVVPGNKRGGVTIWGMHDKESWLGGDKHALLFDGPAGGPYKKKPAYYGVAEALGSKGGSPPNRPSPPSPPPSPSRPSPPAPRPSPSSPPSGGNGGSCTAAWGNCQKTGCCVSGYTCHKASQWYSQCKKGGNGNSSPPSNPKPSPPRPSPPSPSSGGGGGGGSCTGAWGNCKNSGCCVSGYKCVKANKWYSQCKKN